MSLPALQTYLTSWTQNIDARAAIARTIEVVCASSIEISALVAKGALAGNLSQVMSRAGEFDEQKKIDVLANESILTALHHAPVAAFASEELAEPVTLQDGAPLLVATDPLDGSSNVNANVSFGMIFSILPARPGAQGEAAFLKPGSQQLAAGLVVYGPQTVLALTVGQGTHVFTLDPATKTFVQTQSYLAIPAETNEYAINASNARHWDDATRMYIHDCENGASGPRGKDFNMRWTGSPVADIYRILSRGGIYLYPGDKRKGFMQGRIRLIYEANPVSWIIEQAGGLSTTGKVSVLDVAPSALHQRTPIICGSRHEVERVIRAYSGHDMKGERSALFGKRGLFRAT